MKSQLASNSVSRTQAAPEATYPGLSDLPHAVMPNIWLRLPEDAMAALLCTAKRFYDEEEFRTFRRLERRFDLTARPTFVVEEGSFFHHSGMPSAYFDKVRDMLDDKSLTQAGRARNLESFIDQPKPSHQRAEYLRICFDALRNLDKSLRGRVLDRIFQSEISRQTHSNRQMLADFQLAFTTTRNTSERALSEEFDVTSMSPHCGTSMKIWFLYAKGYVKERQLAQEMTNRNANAEIAAGTTFAELIEFMKGTKDSQVVDALPWVLAFCAAKTGKTQMRHRPFGISFCEALPTQGSLNTLARVYFHRCRDIQPELAVQLHMASLELLFLQGIDICFAPNDPNRKFAEQIQFETVVALIYALAQLKGETHDATMEYLMHRMGSHFFEINLNFEKLCNQIVENSATKNRARLIAQAMLVYALNQSINYARKNHDDACSALESMADICQSLPVEDMTAEVLATFSCMTAYLNEPELQSRMLDWIIAILASRSPFEHPRLLVLLAHLSVFFSSEDGTRLRTVLKEFAKRLSKPYENVLTAALHGSFALADALGKLEIGQKVFYSSLWRNYSSTLVDLPALDCLTQGMELILSGNYHQEFTTSFFLQMEAMQTWPSLNKQHLSEPLLFFSSNDGWKNSDHVVSDSSQDELQELNMTLSPGTQLNY
ncbi:hypothetical protein [Noviherbaspirillum pedocola]|uniref:Uncharacterized protein n=1 Tax=Noviherbaspirillum pedocola TaxID=2801341 RepID=A0A934W493_9BURK|nr:hypothetical protein [Noviherbaspirillum pedocola]MBK4733632.1 hypothetical protein [Noviherbaspirillum pedocola]